MLGRLCAINHDVFSLFPQYVDEKLASPYMVLPHHLRPFLLLCNPFSHK